MILHLRIAVSYVIPKGLNLLFQKNHRLFGAQGRKPAKNTNVNDFLSYLFSTCLMLVKFIGINHPDGYKHFYKRRMCSKVFLVEQIVLPHF